MKKLITFLMLLSVFGIGNVWADNVTFNQTNVNTAQGENAWSSIKTPKSGTYTYSVDYSSLNFLFTGTDSKQVSADGSSLKFQNGTGVTISGTGIYITGITITATNNGHIFTDFSSNDNGVTQTWSSSENVSSVTVVNGSENIYVSQIVVTYTTASSTLPFTSTTSLTDLPISGTITINGGENIALVNNEGASVGLYKKIEYDANNKTNNMLTSQSINGQNAIFNYSGLEYGTEYVLEIWENQYKSSSDENKKNARQTFTYTTLNAVLTAESNRYWNNWNSFTAGTYNSAFIENNLEFYAKNDKTIIIATSGTHTESGESFTGSSYLYGGDNYIHFKVAANSKITIYSNVADNSRTLNIAQGSKGGTLLASGSNNVLSAFSPEASDIFVYTSNSGAYIYGIKVEPTLSQFEFNAGDVLYYKDNTTREFVNNTTFEYNATYVYLRTKLIIDPDYNSLTNPTFSVTSSDNTVLDVTTDTPHFNRASDNRIYVDNIKVLKAGTATLTFTFNGADNYAGPVSVEQAFNITAGQAPTIAMETPSPTSDVPVSTSIVLTSDRTISAVGETITGTLNGEAITFTLTNGNTLTYTPASNLANGTLYTVVLNSGQVKGTNNLTNAESTFTFTTIAAVSSLSAVSDKVWNFGDWSTGNYTSTIITSENIEIISANNMTVDASNKTFDDTDEVAADNLGTIKLTQRIKTGGESSASNRLIHFKVKKGATISVLALSQGSGDRTLNLCVGSYDKDNPTATLATNTTNVQKLKYKYDGDADEADIYLGSTGGIGIYYIKVSKNKKAVSMRPGGSQPGNSAANPLAVNTTSFNYLIVTTVDGGSIRNLFPSAGDISSDNFEISSSNSSIVNVSKAKYSAAEDDLSKGRFGIKDLSTGNQGGTADITLHYKGTDTYSEATTTFTLYVNGPEPFDMNVSNLTVQNGQQVSIMPTITNQNGEPIGFDGSGNVIILDEDADVDYNNYFNFAYSIASNDAGLSLDPSDNSIVVSEEGDGYVGKTATVTVTATPKSEYAAEFTNASVIKTLAVEVIAKETVNYIDFWLDKNKTTRVTDVYSYTLDGSTSVFENFPNGRIIYVDIKDAGLAAGAEEIWFSYNVGSSVKVTPSSAGKTDYGKKQYLLNMSRGGMVPIHIDGEGTDVFVNFQCFKRTGKDSKGNILYESVGSVIPVKFTVAYHDRPAVVTYDPQSPDEDASLNTDGYKIRNTSQSVVAIGATGNDIFAKFSSKGTNYTIEGLLNEPNVVEGTEKVGVFSTEVAARKISGVQIQMYDDVPFVSTMTTMTYFYRYATTLTVSPTSYTIDVDNPTAIAETIKATYYDKVKKSAIDETDAEGAITYSIENFNGADAEINASEGNLTKASTKSGMSIVTITYDNATNYTVNKRTSRMDVATATYVINWVKSGEHLPKIEPVSQKFYPTINVTVTADETWDTWYIIKDTDEAVPDAAAIISNGTKVDKNTNKNFDLDATKVVYAVATDGATTPTYTKVIKETYTLGEEVLPPYFVPDGTVTGGYKYYTETLDVEARTNTAGASVYYTTDGTEPVIGASNTYLYDGLSGITLTDGGTTIIKAIAVKDGIQSTVTTSTYVQSALDAPYFQKNGSGEYTSGSVEVTTTDNISIGSNANPGSYTLVYYYTLDGSEPTVENGIRATSSSTFNVVKTVDAKSIAVLVDGSGNIVSTSSVTMVRFNVTLDGNRSYVWEANNITTPNGHMGREDGFVISTETSLPLAKANASVHLKSLPATGQPITFAQQYITATFGGYEFGDWNHFTISDEALGTPIDGVGEFNIRSDKDNGTYPGDDALTEGGYMYSHIFTGQSTSYNGTYYTGKDASTSVAKPTTVHEKTFLLPVKGAYVKFEPERDGELTIWALQQGAIHYNEDAGLCDRFIRRRPVYFIDEQGKSYRAKKAESSARLSAHWNTIISGYASEGKNWFKGLGETQTAGGKTVTNNFYNEDESEAIYNMFLDYFMKRGDYATGYGSGIISVGDPIQPIPIHTSSRATNPITERGGNNSDNSTDMTGYVLASGGYVKYTFEVKAGKTYYFFGHATKIGIRGFQFVPSEDDATVTARTQKTIAETGVTDAATAYGTDNAGTIKVKLNRTFNANTWAGLVLPFSVSETQMQKVFGAGTKVIHFSDVADTQINLVHHWYDMVVAGTPVLIYPTKTVSPTFDGVQVEGITSGVEKLGETNASSTYYMMGTYINLDAANGEKKNDYYITASTGAFKRLSSDNSAVKPTRVWLRPKDPNNAKALVVNIEDFFYGDTTGIISIEDDNSYKNSSANDNIYNLQGQKVGKGSTSNLQRGVYIVNGKKIVVK